MSMDEFDDVIETFLDPAVKYDEHARKWEVFTVVKAMRYNRYYRYWTMWIKYEEQTGVPNY